MAAFEPTKITDELTDEQKKKLGDVVSALFAEGVTGNAIRKYVDKVILEGQGDSPQSVEQMAKLCNVSPAELASLRSVYSEQGRSVSMSDVREYERTRTFVRQNPFERR